MVNLKIFGNEIYLVFPKISGIFILELENNRKLYIMTTIEQTKDFTSDYLTSDEIHRLCRYFNKLGNHRMELLCLFGTKTLLRYSDMKRIRWFDVLDKDVLVLNEKKTQKRRTITLSQSLKNDIRKTYNQLQPPMDGFIFKYSLQHTNVLLKEGGKDCKIRNKNISTHSFRKSGGRYVYETFGCSDDSLIKLSLLLNHSTTSITRRYLSIQKEEIEDIYQSFDVF